MAVESRGEVVGIHVTEIVHDSTLQLSGSPNTTFHIKTSISPPSVRSLASHVVSVIPLASRLTKNAACGERGGTRLHEATRGRTCKGQGVILVVLYHTAPCDEASGSNCSFLGIHLFRNSFARYAKPRAWPRQ